MVTMKLQHSYTFMSFNNSNLEALKKDWPITNIHDAC